jgi:hypothetical protein
MSAWTYRSSDGKAANKIVPPCPRTPWWKGLCADSEEKRGPVSDVNAVEVDSQSERKCLTPNGRLEKQTSQGKGRGLPIRSAGVRTTPPVDL